MADHETTCPHCGQELTEVTLGGDHPPFVCTTCHIAFWAAELSNLARDNWRPSHRDFGHGEHVALIRSARDVERTSR